MQDQDWNRNRSVRGLGQLQQSIDSGQGPVSRGDRECFVLEELSDLATCIDHASKTINLQTCFLVFGREPIEMGRWSKLVVANEHVIGIRLDGAKRVLGRACRAHGNPAVGNLFEYIQNGAHESLPKHCYIVCN
jgi:hypothetical protein